jgi:hypothetical protein
MTTDEFRNLLEHQSDQQLLDPCLREDQAPYVFEPMPAKWDTFRDELVSDLKVSRGDIRVVGSARFGFSMKPWNQLRSFRDKSDIDVVIVNPGLFDQLWLALLTAAYPRDPVLGQLGGWLARRKNELYTGWLSPLEIRLDISIYGRKAKPVMDFNARWFNALKRASKHPPRRHEDISGRLYRTWSHAELYHLHSLGELRRSLAE